MTKKINFRNRNLSFSPLDIRDFPINVRDEVKNNYCGDKAAIQGFELCELVKSRSHSMLIPHPNFVDESTDFDESGVYYGYIISTKLSRNHKWVITKILIEFDKVRIIFVPACMGDPNYEKVVKSLGRPIHCCERQLIKLTVDVYADRYGNEKSCVNKIEPMTEQEKQIIYCAAKGLGCSFEQQ